jgi:hypothetical protein
MARNLLTLLKLIIMNNRDNERQERTNDDASPKPDAGTTHTTDPQKNMEGPVSSLMHQTGDSFETDETKGEAEEKKDRKM